MIQYLRFFLSDIYFIVPKEDTMQITPVFPIPYQEDMGQRQFSTRNCWRRMRLIQMRLCFPRLEGGFRYWEVI